MSERSDNVRRSSWCGLFKLTVVGALSCLIASSVHPALAGQKTAKTVSGEGITGVLKRHEQFSSKFVAARNVDVWLPAGYARGKRRRYPVVYMHDGQNVFDPRTAYGGVEWGVDETITRLVQSGVLREAIVVGIWNSPKRFAEYMPRKAVPFSNTKDIKNIALDTQDEIISDDYLKFLVRELKPFIDSRYRTMRDRANTFVMGSSMGGLISAYAISEYPRVFGGAACVSTHWPAGDGAGIEYLKTHMPDPRTHKLYFDYGTATLDAQYEPYQKRMDEVMLAAGYTEGKNWVTRKFEGAQHSEKSWSARVDIPLVFFLHK
ncbi:MAG: alpha/beta hydrolase [Rubrivivax sp.]|nr:alpha/beta hydrolase [Pyrinomonadaceae bacterium]